LESVDGSTKLGGYSVPSGNSLCLNTHLPVMTLAWGGRGAISQVRFRCRASNSSFMAACHCGSRSAARA
jgi:hypothetical protein